MIKTVYQKKLESIRDLIRGTSIVYGTLNDYVISHDYVYKVKRVTDALKAQYGTVEKRRNACRIEMELGVRFCAAYDNIFKLIDDDGQQQIVEIEHPYPAIEYLVRMHRIPERSFLSYKLEVQEIDQATFEHLGEVFANKLKDLYTNAGKAIDYGSFHAVRINFDEIFKDITSKLNVFTHIDRSKFFYVKNNIESFIENSRELFRYRANNGFVRNGHGNIQLKNVYIDAAGPGVIGVIEHSDRLRYNDIVSEIAKMAVELDIIGYKNYSDYLVKGFFSVVGDENSRRLLSFYKVFRGLQSLYRVLNEMEGIEEWSPDFIDLNTQANNILMACIMNTYCLLSARAVVFTGYMGVGKTKNVQFFQQIGAVEAIHLDRVRKRANGVDIQGSQSTQHGYNVGIYENDKTLNAYYRAGKAARDALALGRFPVIDAAIINEANFHELCQGLKQVPYVVQLTADDEMIKERLLKRHESDPYSDGNYNLYLEQRDEYTFEKFDFSMECSDIAMSNIDYFVLNCIVRANEER